jgi:hypothetical protein
MLSARVLERWNALIKGDFDAAYLFESPAYRNIYSVKQYGGRYGKAIKWKAASIDKIKFGEQDTAVVAVNITYSVFLPATGTVETATRWLEEKWLRRDGKWWHAIEG